MGKKKTDPADIAKRVEATQDALATIEALKRENQALRRKVNVRAGAASLLLDHLEDVLRDNPYEIVVTTPAKPPRRKETEAAVLHYTDPQLGKTTETYSSRIARDRARELTRKTCTVIDRHRKYANVDEVYLLLGGDLVEGEGIFEGQVYELDQALWGQAVKDMPELIAEMVGTLASHVQRVHVYGVPGNHGRTGRKGQFHSNTNWDKIAMEFGRMAFEVGADEKTRKRVNWHLPDRWWVTVPVMDWKILLIHGDQLGGCAIGGAAFERRVLKWGHSIGEAWDALFFGHRHIYMSGTVAGMLDWFCGSSTESGNDFALRCLSESSRRPRQRLQFWNKEHGMVADRPIYLSEGL